MTFYFYDVETSGRDPRSDRIIQFAGQRTDEDFKPIGEPIGTLIRLTPDVLPDPDAILVTSITPQVTLAQGRSEAAFLQLFYEKVVASNTLFVGFNSITFDDEFLRFLHYRNFYDPYAWQWRNGCSRWDLLDTVRMIRALRPDGITWPIDAEGKPRNRLELLTSANALDHVNAHSALGDVHATIALAHFLRTKQPQLFTYLMNMRSKDAVKRLASGHKPFIHTSGWYAGRFEHTTVVMAIALHPTKQAALVYDLRSDPRRLAMLSAEELAEQWLRNGPHTERFPITTLHFNRCPAVASLDLLDAPAQSRLAIDLKSVQENFSVLEAVPTWQEKVLQALSIVESRRQTQSSLLVHEQEVDGMLYDGFFDDHDQRLMRAVRTAPPDRLLAFTDKLHDERLKALLSLYKARTYPNSLTPRESEAWHEFCRQRLQSGGGQSRLARYTRRLEELRHASRFQAETHILEELWQYGQSVAALHVS